MLFLMLLAACCPDGDAIANANARITRDGGDPVKAVCSQDGSDGYECNYYGRNDRVYEIECTRCGCQYDD